MSSAKNVFSVNPKYVKLPHCLNALKTYEFVGNRMKVCVCGNLKTSIDEVFTSLRSSIAVEQNDNFQLCLAQIAELIHSYFFKSCQFLPLIGH
jgi:hypothetical protein